MNTTVQCPGCGQTLLAPPQFGGKRASCPKCKASVEIPLLVSASPAAGAPTIAFEPGPMPAIPLPPGHAAAGPPPLPAQPRGAGPGKPQPPAATPPPIPGQSRSNSPWKTDSPPPLPSPVRPTAAPPAVISPPAAQSRRSGGRWIAVVVVLAVLLAGGGAAAWMFLFAGHGIGGDSRFLPDDPDIVATFDGNAILTSAAGKKLRAAMSDMFAQLQAQIPQESKIKPEDIGRITVGIGIRSGENTGVAHFLRPVSEQDFPHREPLNKKTVGAYQLLVGETMSVCFLDGQTVAFGSEEALRKILERNGPAKLSGDLAAAANETDFSKPLAVAMSAGAVRSERRCQSHRRGS